MASMGVGPTVGPTVGQTVVGLQASGGHSVTLQEGVAGANGASSTTGVLKGYAGALMVGIVPSSPPASNGEKSGSQASSAPLSPSSASSGKCNGLLDYAGALPAVDDRGGGGTACCLPSGCPRSAEKILMGDTRDAVKVVCNSDTCTVGEWMHATCFQQWEQQVRGLLLGFSVNFRNEKFTLLVLVLRLS